MPSRAARPCSVPGCPNLVTGREAQCREHQHRADKRKGTRTARGYDNVWGRIAKAYLRAHPFCEWPDCSRLARTVDHIDGDNRHHDPDNLRALCWPHHNRRTGLDQPGGARLQ